MSDLAGWLVGWLVCCCIWLVGWLAGWLVRWLAAGWLLLAHTQPIAVLARYKEKAGWAQKKTRQTPLLNDAHKDARIEYCVRNEGEDFRRRAMIDEKIFEDTPPRQ